MNKLLASLGLCLVALVTLAATVAGPVSAGRPEKVSVCHVDLDAGTVEKLSVGASAASAHLGHGDVLASDDPCPPVAAPTAESLCVSFGGVYTGPDDGVTIWSCAGADWTVEGAVRSLAQRCDDDGGLASLEGTSTTFSTTCSEILPVDAARSLCVGLGGDFVRPADGITIWTCAGVDQSIVGAQGSLAQRCSDDGGLPSLEGTLQTVSVTCDVIVLPG